MVPFIIVTLTLAAICSSHVAHSTPSLDPALTSSFSIRADNKSVTSSISSSDGRFVRDTHLASESERHTSDGDSRIPLVPVDLHKYVFDYFREPHQSKSSSSSTATKRKWSSVSAWGKRGDDSVSESTTGDKSASSSLTSDEGLPPLNKMNSGLTSAVGEGFPRELNSINKRWAQISSWGKRSASKSWGSDTVSKLRQTALQGVRAAGDGSGTEKHGIPDTGNENEIAVLDERNQLYGGLNKGWNNQMSTLGKREVLVNGVLPAEKKWNSVSAWGKRSDESTSDLGSNSEWRQMSLVNKGDLFESSDVIDGNDKKWAQISSWGKRDGSDNLIANSDKKWAQISSWGKRDQDLIPSKKWAQVSAWGKRDIPDSDPTKKWAQVSAWGKRDFLVGNPDKKWAQVSAWGKRNLQHNDLDKKWAQVSAWGKRDDEDKNLVKKWAQVSAWGKRDSKHNDFDKKWAQVSAWGKRDSKQNDLDKKWAQVSAWGKRDSPSESRSKRWAQISSWGKRLAGIAPSIKSYIDSIIQRPSSYAHKRWKTANFWGKRNYQDDDDSNSSIYNKDKRWASVSAWGKRANGQGYDDADTNFDKRWASVSAWGKRAGGLGAMDKRARPRGAARWGMWGKRPSWSHTGFTSWGKRGGDWTLGHTMDRADPIVIHESDALGPGL